MYKEKFSNPIQNRIFSIMEYEVKIVFISLKNKDKNILSFGLRRGIGFDCLGLIGTVSSSYKGLIRIQRTSPTLLILIYFLYLIHMDANILFRIA